MTQKKTLRKKEEQLTSHSKTNEILQQTQRLLAWRDYQDSLKNVDQEVLKQLQITTSHLRVSLWTKVITYIFQFTVISIALFFSLRESLKTSQVNSETWVISLISLVLLGILLFRNPIHSINQTHVDLVRVQIVLQGYARQINQVDAIFKQALLENNMDIRNVSKSLDHLQRVIDGNVESLLQILDEES